MGVQVRYRSFDAAALLEEPSPTQLRVLEYIAEAFMHNGREWPVFDYVEGHFEGEGIDVWGEIRTLPVHPHGYYAVALPTNRPPDPGERVALTMLGLFQAEVMDHIHTGLDRPFLLSLNFLAKLRREAPRSANTPRSFKVLSGELLHHLAGAPDPDLTAPRLAELMDREPPTWGGSSQTDEEGNWAKDITRAVLPFYGVNDIRDYLNRLIETLTLPAVEADSATPSPLGLVAAIDYLDTVWRLSHSGGSRLFDLHSAQGIAQLAFAANTPAEFESRLSGLGDLLRSIRVPSADDAAQKKAKRARDKPLAALEAHLVGLLPESRQRIGRAIAVLHHVIDVRDAGQHAPARGKGAKALAALGVGYPPTSWPNAWDTVTARTIEALDAIREALATLT